MTPKPNTPFRGELLEDFREGEKLWEEEEECVSVWLEQETGNVF